MKEDQFESLPTDTEEWIRLLQTDDGRAAREHLAAGRAIYYRETDTPPGVCIKKHSDGHREWITIDRRTGRESVIRTLNEDDPAGSRTSALAQRGEDVGHDFRHPLGELEAVRDEGVVVDVNDEAALNRRLDEVAASTRKANDALDDALSFIAASTLRIDKMRSGDDED
jgi:hypothetical protein